MRFANGDCEAMAAAAAGGEKFVFVRVLFEPTFSAKNTRPIVRPGTGEIIYENENYIRRLDEPFGTVKNVSFRNEQIYTRTFPCFPRSRSTVFVRFNIIYIHIYIHRY